MAGAGEEGEEEEEDEDEEAEEGDATLAAAGTGAGFPSSPSLPYFSPAALLVALPAREAAVPCASGGVFLSVATAAAPSLADLASASSASSRACASSNITGSSVQTSRAVQPSPSVASRSAPAYRGKEQTKRTHWEEKRNSRKRNLGEEKHQAGDSLQLT